MKIKEITSEGLGAQYKIIKTGPEGTVLQSPDMHTQLTLDPEASKGIVQNPQNPNQFTLSQAAASGTTDQTQMPAGPKIGAEVEVPANEAMGEGYQSEFDTFIEDENGDEIPVKIEYNIFGEDVPARINYDDYDHPAEYAEIDGYKVTNLDTGEDITKSVDNDSIEELIWHDAKNQDSGFEEDVGGDPTDDFIDDVRDKEFEKHNKPSAKELDDIKRLSGI